jgi:hypothetical protein
VDVRANTVSSDHVLAYQLTQKLAHRMKWSDASPAYLRLTLRATLDCFGSRAATSFYEKGNIRVRYREIGSGFPLLVVPGGGLNSRIADWPASGMLTWNEGEAY